MKNKIYFATTNDWKYKSYAKRLNAVGIELVKVSLEIPESRDFSTKEVALKKLEYAAGIIKERPLMVEDRGFEVESLNNFPGSHVKLVTNNLGIEKFLEIARHFDTKAKFTYSIALVNKDGKVSEFFGEERGRLLVDKAGSRATNLADVFGHELFENKALSDLSNNEKCQYEEYWTKFDALEKLIKSYGEIDRAS